MFVVDNFRRLHFKSAKTNAGLLMLEHDKDIHSCG